MTDKDKPEPESFGPDNPFPVQPLRNQVIVSEVDLVPESKIVMPDMAKSRLGTRYGRAVAVGPGTTSPFTGEMHPCEIELGVVVMYGEYAGHKFLHNGFEYNLLQMSDIVARVDVERFKPAIHKRQPKASDGLPALGEAPSPAKSKRVLMP